MITFIWILEMFCVTKMSVASSVVDECPVSVQHWWNDSDRGEPNHRREPFSSAISCTKNAIVTGLFHQYVQGRDHESFCEHRNKLLIR